MAAYVRACIHGYTFMCPACPKLNCTTPGYNGTFTIAGASGVTVKSAGTFTIAGVNDATVAATRPYAPGQKHGPGQQGGSGPCDADCVKCANQAKARQPSDPLDVEYDGVRLRDLLDMDADARHEGWAGTRTRKHATPAQRAAVAAHWSAELRAKVAAGTAADKEREARRVLVDLDDEDRPW